MTAAQDVVQFAGKTDVGMRRPNNQDFLLTSPASSARDWETRGHVFVVADGMGAHAVGELASQLAAKTIVHTYRKLQHLDPLDALEESFTEANRTIHQRGRANPDFHGMGTTATALVLSPLGAIIGHVGDSRAYRIRGNKIEQLSCDHSLTWELIRRQDLTEEQARSLVPSNVITRSLGPEPEVQVDVEGPYEVQEGDVFVLCSDGLSGLVHAPEIAILASVLPEEEAVDRLIDLANLRGGTDNITVMIVRATRSFGKRGREGLGTRLRRWALRLAFRYLLDPVGLHRGGMWALVTGGISLAAGVVLRWIAWSSWYVPLICGLALAALGAGALALSRVTASWCNVRQRILHSEPYTRFDFELTPEFLRPWLQWLEEVRDEAIGQGWQVEWDEYYSHRDRFRQFLEEGKSPEAVREFAECIRLLADAQRRRRKEELVR